MSNQKISERIKVLEGEIQQARLNLNKVVQTEENLKNAIISRQGGILELQKLLISIEPATTETTNNKENTKTSIVKKSATTEKIIEKE